MSSFIHSPEFFNSIENKLLSELENKSNYFFKKVNNFDIKDMMKEMRNLSILCVSYEYAHHYDDIKQEIKNQKKYMKSVKEFRGMNLIDLYKALSSLEYQMEIHHLTNLRELKESEQRALNLFIRIKIGLADHIVTNSEVYDSSKWWSFK